MAASLTVVDNADGTGATGTVAGSSGLNTVKVWQPVSGTRLLTMVNTFTRTGNGTLALTMDNGVYFATLENGGAIAGVPSWFQTTDGVESLFNDCLEGVVARIQTLALSGIGPSDVRLVKLPVAFADGTYGRDGVLVSPIPEQIERKYNVSDDESFGCMVTIYHASNKDVVGGLERDLAERQTIIEGFKITPSRSAQSILGSGLVEAFDILLEPASVVNPQAWIETNYDVGAVVVRVKCRVRRG